jgi:hypothetical protein
MVRNGEKTLIWHDNWIADTPSMGPLGMLEDTGVWRVCDLIGEDTGNRKVNVTDKTFFSPDAAAIKAIPRPTIGGEDIWSWPFEKTGLYTVRPAYHLLVENINTADEDASSSSGQTDGWLKLWKLQEVSSLACPLHIRLHLKQKYSTKILGKFLETFVTICTSHHIITEVL